MPSEDFIHPIIQAMIQSADLKSRALDRQNQSDQAKEQADFRRKQLAETVKRAEQEHALNLQNLQIQKDHYDLAVKQFHNQAQHGILADIASGARPVESLSSAPTIPTALNSQPDDPSQIVTPSPASVQPAPNFSMMPQPGPSDSQDGNVDVGGTSMPRAAIAQIPARVAAQKGAVAKATAQAVVDAQQPEREALEKQRAQDRVDQLTVQADARKSQLEDQQKFLAHESELNRQNRVDIAAITKAAVQRGANPEQVHALMENGTTGDSDIQGTTPAALAAQDAAGESGRKLFGTKSRDALKAAVNLQNYINQLKTFANKLPSDSLVGKAAAIKNGVVNRSELYKTDLANEYDGINTNLINAGKSLEGVSGGRVTIPMMNLLKSGSGGLNLTKSQATKLADNLQSRLHNQVDQVILGGIGETQRQLIFHKQGVTPESLGLTGSHSTNLNLPDFLKVAPPKNKNGTPLNINESIQRGAPVYGGQ